MSLSSTFLRLLGACLVCWWGIVPALADDAVLEFSLEGLEDELEDNALAWLGSLPETPQERLNFLVRAEDRVRDSLRALGYYRAEVNIETQRVEPVWQMVITVEPGEPVKISSLRVEVLGPGATDEVLVALLAEQPFEVGDVLHHGHFDSFRRRLLATSQRRGYFDGQIEISRVRVNAEAGSAELELVYASGERYRFGEVSFDPERINEEQVEALRGFDEGDPFDLLQLQELQVQLRRTNYFSSIIIQPELDQAEQGRIPINLQLQPAKRHSFDVGVGYSTDTEERLSLTWRTPKINRFGHHQETRLQYSAVNPSGRITYSIPLTHPLDDFLQLWGRLEDNEFGDLDSQQKELGVRREQRLQDWILGYSFRSLDESWSVVGEYLGNQYQLPGVSLSRRDRWAGSLVDPSAGFSQLYTVEGASKDLGSDVDMVRLVAHLRGVYTPWEKHRFVGRLELGAAILGDGDRTSLAPSLNFFAGGSQSIRGYAYQSLGNELTYTTEEGQERTLIVGGDRLLVSSLEYQYYVTPRWRGALFVDAGDAFDDGEFEANVGVGVGVHMVTQVGALRLEVANSVTEDNPGWRLHFNIGAEF